MIHGDWMGGWGTGYMGGWGGLWMILVVVAVILGIVVLVRWVGKSSASSGTRVSNAALDALNERYAPGEIEKQEFEEKKRALGK
ncbi:SHOCT domain-containing protein [Thiobacillus denitrificans]|uniref:SHOCT domain-containing protein n=1 Tax=Thiobacillus denitrificans TaxID=36861 RepID=UPI000374ABB8|nr:SHOCT domain-containing protein [Thiobacillus denitrificans]